VRTPRSMPSTNARQAASAATFISERKELSLMHIPCAPVREMCPRFDKIAMSCLRSKRLVHIFPRLFNFVLSQVNGYHRNERVYEGNREKQEGT